MFTMKGSHMFFKVINVFCVFMRKCYRTLKVEILFVHLKGLYRKP